ncbi:MAG: hypothetical protein QM765_16505 [Myxococcales bacterium]
MSPNSHRPRPRGHRLPTPVRTRLAQAVDAFGEDFVRAACGVSRIALARALGGLPVLAGTIALVERGLGRLEATSKDQEVGHV